MQLRVLLKALRLGAPPPGPPVGPGNFTRIIDAAALQVRLIKPVSSLYLTPIEPPI